MLEQTDLEQRLAEAEATLEALRLHEVDAIVGTSRVMVLRLQEAEAKLRKSDQRLQMALDACGGGIYERSLPLDEGSYHSDRWAEILGFQCEELPPYHRLLEWLLEQVHPADREPLRRAYGDLTEGRTPRCDVELRIRHKLGHWIWVRDVSKVVQRDQDGRVRRVVGVMFDITSSKQAEENLREADRQKDVFLATLAHELRNPLAPICTGLEVMKLAQDDPATINEIRGTLERQTQQLVTLVNDLLDVSRVTLGKLELRKCHVALRDVIETAVEAARSSMGESHHELSVDVPSEPCYLHADPHRIAQVLSNLLNNAAKYTPAGGRIWLTASRQGNEILVVVKDDGIGIPAEMLDKIFGMFTQVDRSYEKSHSGLGIGLTLVKSLLEMHEGSIEVHSEGRDRGSEFRVRLPSADENADPPTAAPIRIASGTRRRVLIVDDNEAARQMLRLAVGLLGHDVRTASDGEQAIHCAAEFLPEVVLMDLGMPRLDGYESARRIRQHSWGERMVLVALTGWSQAEDKQRSKEAGFDWHLVKPADHAALQEILSKTERGSD